MKLSSLFRLKHKPDEPIEVAEENLQDAEKKGNLITIKWGTGMPIDIIFNYLHKDFEEEGYQDAFIDSDLKYKEIKEDIIINDLRLLFKRIILRYQADIRNIEIQLNKAKEVFAVTSSSMLQAKLDTCQEHIEEINEMERKLNQKQTDDIVILKSYRRGFFKGITAQTMEFIKN